MAKVQIKNIGIFPLNISVAREHIDKKRVEVNFQDDLNPNEEMIFDLFGLDFITLVEQCSGE